MFSSLLLKLRSILFLIGIGWTLWFLSGCHQAKPSINLLAEKPLTTQLDVRMTAIETWINGQSQSEKANTPNVDMQFVQITQDIENQLKPIQKQLIELKQQLHSLKALQQNILQQENKIQDLEARLNFVLSKTNGTQKVNPPDWLYKIIWEKKGMIYAVGVSTNKKLAILNAQNALRNYFNSQIVDQVQVLETFQQSGRFYVLVTKKQNDR